MLLLYNRPVQWGEGEVRGQHSQNRLVRSVAVALPSHDRKEWSGVEAESAP